MKQNILILGSGSRAASRLGEYLLSSNKNFNFLTPESYALDITDHSQLKSFFVKYEPTCTINFAAKTDLKITESERGDKNLNTWKINVDGVKNLVEQCNMRNCYLIQMSTSMVFSGTQVRPGPYPESAHTENNYNLLCWYGITKIEAEKYIRKYSNLYSIIRLSNVARGKSNKKNDILWRILKQYKEDDLNPFFYNQQLTLTDLTELSLVLSKLITNKVPGILHVSDSEQTTPYKIASYLIKTLGWNDKKIKKISIDKYFRDNKDPSLKHFYPKYWGLSSGATQKSLGIKFKSWQQIIDDFVQTDNPTNYL